MAIPPSPGKFTVDELQKELDAAKDMVVAAENKLAEAKKAGLAEVKPAAGRGGKFPDTAPPKDFVPIEPGKAKSEVKPSIISTAPKK